MYSLFSNVTTRLILFSVLFCCACTHRQRPRHILVFSKTAGFRHIEGIEAGTAALKKLCEGKDIALDTTEDAGKFNEETLRQYNAVVFLNVSGEVFTQEQRYAFQRYIEAGGGFLAIHGVTDAEREWPWFGQLIGAYFNSHPQNPNVRKGTYVVMDKNNPATDSLPARWEREDEFYNFQQVDSSIHILIGIDEKTYEGGNMGAFHPMVWYHDFDGGRSFYISMGHTNETYTEPLFIKMLGAGLEYAVGGKEPPVLNYARSIPEENRFVRHNLMEKLDEPMQMAFSGDGTKIFFAERRGDIVVYDQQKSTGRVIGTIPVSSRYEDGLLGLATDPKFDENKWIYAFYTTPMGTEFHVARFTLGQGDTLDLGSRKTLLKIPKDVLDGSHTGGGLLFDPRGSGDLYITVGDNTSPRATGFAPSDERDGRMVFDAQRSAGNTNDLRGKILRIHPEADGTYSIPEGNLFAKGLDKARPEIYTMGHRQPWRLSIDTRTGWLHEGEVGPDAEKDSAGRGPMGLDEFNIIKKPGNYGWPYFLGNNQPYNAFDFATGISGSPFDAAKPENHSRYNTGLTQLPPAEGAFLWYPYAASKEFPLMGTGARCAAGGPVFHRNDFKNAATVFPEYYEGKWFITDWIRGWIMVVTMDVDGHYQSMEPFMPDTRFASPLDMQFGPDGALYVLEYGSGWFQANDNARLVRIEYNPGNREPLVKVHADKLAGAAPFNVRLSSSGTRDEDPGDQLTYQWTISTGNTVVKTFETANPDCRLEGPGLYDVILTVTDNHGAAARASLQLTAGNEPPELKMEITKGNRTFFFPNTAIGYAVTIQDREDGLVKNDSNAVVSINYLAQGFTPQKEGSGHAEAADDFSNIGPQLLINGNDCYSCHAIDKKSAGPSFKEVADRYRNDGMALQKLSRKIITGGNGNWGQVSMSAHPGLSDKDARMIVKYILDMSKDQRKGATLPLSGTYTPGQPKATDDKGVVLLQASYTDRGANGVPPASSKSTVVLRRPVFLPSEANVSKGYMQVKLVSQPVILYMMYGTGAYLGFDNIDLSGIKSIHLDFSPAAASFVEVHLDSPEGPLIGQSAPNDKTSSEKNPGLITIKKTEGVHHVYFVSRNILAKKNDFMMTYNSIVFQQE